MIVFGRVDVKEGWGGEQLRVSSFDNLGKVEEC